MSVIDTLRLKTRLSDSGMPESQAQALVEELDEVLSTAITAQVATKADVAELRAAIDGCATKAELAELKGVMQADMAELKSATKADMAELKSATKADMAELKSATKADMTELKSEMKFLRWMMGAVLTIVVAIGIRLLFM